MKIKAIKINNFVGVDEFNYNPGNITILEGPKGAGKSSVLEAIETAVSNNKRRTEVIKHGQEEATLFIETDSGLEIDRKLRNGKSDYFKLRQEGEGIKSTETELRKLLSGDIFRPLDFINLPIKEQTTIILNMIKMNYSPEEIIQWFGDEEVLSGINTDKHLLQILKDIEVKNYATRQEVNREIATLEAQAKGIEKTLPDNYDGEAWRTKSVQEYYSKVSEAQKINGFIQEAKNLKENIDNKVDTIISAKDSQISRIKLKYSELKTDIQDIIDLANNKISAANNTISNLSQKEELETSKLEAQRLAEIESVNQKYTTLKSQVSIAIASENDEQNMIIDLQNGKIIAKQSELDGLEDKKLLEIEGVEKETLQKVEAEKARVGKAADYLENHEPIDIEPLQVAAEEVEQMREHLREWDRMLELKNGVIANKKAYSDKLTGIIEIARIKPSELLKQHKLPIDGIGVDENSMIRINGTLLDGLSDGEKLEAAFKIALQRIGELRIICIDGFEKLNETEQRKIIKLCEDNDIQAFITITKDTENGLVNIKEEI